MHIFFCLFFGHSVKISVTSERTPGSSRKMENQNINCAGDSVRVRIRVIYDSDSIAPGTSSTCTINLPHQTLLTTVNYLCACVSESEPIWSR